MSPLSNVNGPPSGITINYPNDVATIFYNPSANPIHAFYLGVHFRGNETVAVLGDPFICPKTPQTWDAKNRITELVTALNRGDILLLSRPNNPDADVRFYYEEAIPSGSTGDGTYSTNVDESAGLLAPGDPRIGSQRPGFRIYAANG
jgi:hypothetical protein